MNTIGSSPQSSYSYTASSPQSKGKGIFSNWRNWRQAFNSASEAGDTLIKTAAQQAEKIGIGTRVKNGLVRMVRMFLFRPLRTGMEIVLHMMTGGLTLPLITGKHFIEGFAGVDSIFIKRKWPFWPTVFSGAKSHGGKTLVELLSKGLSRKI